MALFSDYHVNPPNRKWHLIEQNPALKEIHKGTPLTGRSRKGQTLIRLKHAREKVAAPALACQPHYCHVLWYLL